MGDHVNVNGTKIKVCNLECVDLSNPEIDQSVALIKKACLDTGLFYAINHGISNELFDGAFAQNKRFFAMPENEKMKVVWNKNHRGYQPPVQKSYVEAYTTSAGKLEDDPNNLWPASEVLPGWKEIIQRYQQETYNVGRRIAKLIALALGLDVDFFEHPKMLGKDNASICTILHYGDQENDSTEEKLGAAPHCDAGVITLLATDDALGLQICRDKDAKPQLWEYVLPMKRAFIVNVGDMLERLSNDTFRSIMHRVVYYQERYCIGVFLLPSYDCIIESVSTHNSQENPPKYSPIKFMDFLSLRYKDVAAGRLQEKIEVA